MFYGWKLAGIGSFGNLMLQGGVIYSMNAFMEPLCDLHGWSRAHISFGMGFASLCSTFSMPVILSLSSRFSIRLIMTVGALAGGGAYIAMGHVANVIHFSLFFAVVMIMGQAFGGVIANLLMQRWFSLCRGRAFGVVNIGTSLSGALLPFAALLLVDALGVAWGYTTMGLILLLTTPLLYMLVRDEPEALGLHPDGAAHAVRPPAPTLAGGGRFGLRELVRMRSTWVIGITFGVGLLTIAGVSSQLKPRFADVGLSSYQAMTCMCLTALFAAVGKFMWGWLCDRTTPVIAARGLFLCNAVFLFFILLPPGVASIAVFIVGYGIAMGGFWTVFPAIIAHVYGRERFTFAYKYLALFLAIKALGYTLMGVSSSRFGSYDPAYMLMIGLLTASFITLCVFRETGQAPQAAATV